jgi:histidinol-phosphatase (PHP family)
MPAGSSINSLPAIDLHLHSTYSADGASSVGEYTRQAEILGLTELGFCEHLDLDPRDSGYGYFDPGRYSRGIAAAQETVPGLCLRQGVEITYQAALEDEIATWLAGSSWDYVMLSVHLVDYADGWAFISEPTAVDQYFATHSQRQAYGPYFRELLRAAQSDLGDVLGHVDLIKRYGVRRYGPFEPAAFENEIRAVLQAAIERGMGLEVNSSGLRQSPGEPYPTLTVLRWYREMGGEILTIGSDAHHAQELGAGTAEAMALAQEAGFRAIATFQKRRVCWIDL